MIKSASLTAAELPITGTNVNYKLSTLNSVFLGLDFANNLQNENAGRAFVHTAATAIGTTIGVEAAATTITATAASGVLGAGIAGNAATWLAGAMVTNPIGWSIATGTVVGFAVGVAYQNNFLGIKDIANEMGDNLNKNIKGIGKFVDSGIKSVQKVFGW